MTPPEVTASEGDTTALAERLYVRLGWSGCAGSSWERTAEPYRRKWLDMAERLAPMFAEVRREERERVLGEAADEVHTEARWQTELIYRGPEDRLLRSYTVERLDVVERILRDRAALARADEEPQA